MDLEKQFYTTIKAAYGAKWVVEIQCKYDDAVGKTLSNGLLIVLIHGKQSTRRSLKVNLFSLMNS